MTSGPCPFGADLQMFRSFFPLIALLMALTLVGHEVAMAGDAHKVTPAISGHATMPHDEARSNHHSPDNPDSSQHPLPAQECSSAVDAGPGRPIELQSAPPGSTVETPAALIAAASDSSSSWAIPGRAADVQRALLQVFLN